ncbi:hypothetical protein BH11MYX3_BH11MYX3_17960 [soil metagenome]
MSSLSDRIGPLCDLLLGAAYADAQFKDGEREEVKAMLADLTGGKLTPELERQITEFDPKKFDLLRSAGAFASDSDDDRRKILFLVAAVNDADEEVDFSEDEYLRDLAGALFLPADALNGLTVDVEVEELRETFEAVRKGPPPPPTKKNASVDVDMD